jgi:hypothetical protein
MNNEETMLDDDDIIDNTPIEKEISDNDIGILDDDEKEIESKEEKKETKEEIPEKPWAKKGEWIPRTRYNEKNEEAQRILAEKTELEKRLSKYEEFDNKVKSISTIEELSSKMAEMSPEEYNKAIIEITRKQIREEFEQERVATEIRKQEIEIANKFEESISTAAKDNPEVIQAKEFVEEYSDLIPADVRYALVTDENAGRLLYDIAATEGMLDKLIKGNPTDSIRILAKMSAKYDYEKEYKKQEPIVEKEIPKKMSFAPKTASSSSPASSKTYGEREADSGKVSVRELNRSSRR